MKMFLRIIGGLAVLVVLGVAGLFGYLNLAFPAAVPASDKTAEKSEVVLARGAYLTNNVSVCMDCHSGKENQYFSGPLAKGTEGKGGYTIAGAPGDIYASNITPAALGDWSDGEIARAIVSGLDKDGKFLVPMMPFMEYRHMSESDLFAIVAYLRTLKPIENEVPDSKANFPLNLIFRTIPLAYEAPPHPDTTNSVVYGEYLAKIAGCQFCHSPFEGGQSDFTREFAGGHEFPGINAGMLRASNITPHQETGIGKWSREAFIARFKAYGDSTGQHIQLKEGDMQTVMPWTHYARMTQSDLGAIYDYLMTVTPIDNAVEIYTVMASSH